MVMNIAMRKLAMLEKRYKEQEEVARVEGYVSSPIDKGLQKRITDLLDRVRTI